MKKTSMAFMILISIVMNTEARPNFLTQFDPARVKTERVLTIKMVEEACQNPGAYNAKDANWKRMRKVHQRKRFFDTIWKYLESGEVKESRDNQLQQQISIPAFDEKNISSGNSVYGQQNP
jgi:hypothetical protein